MMRRPGSLRLLGLIASVLTAGALVAAPALAAGVVHVSLSYDAATLQMPGTDLTNGGKVATPQLQPCRKGGGTFADTTVNATGFPAGKVYTPTGSAVSFQMPTSATGNNAVCAGLGVAGKASVTINVPKGNYTDAYFLAAVGGGPATANITPMYGSTKGSPIEQTFPDWCQTTPQVNNKPTENTTAGWNGGPRVSYAGSTSGQTKLPCGYYTEHVSGLDSSKQLTALDVTLQPVGTTMTAAQAGKTGATNGSGAVLNIMALTLQGTALPGTGGSPLLPVAGVLALGLGAVLLYRPRFGRSTR